jgi:CHAD domain-containing protein
VAARRLRSALSTFKDLVADDRAPAVKANLKWLAQSLDEARNLDVFADVVAAQAKDMASPPPGLEELTAALDVARRRAWTAAAETASSARFRILMIDTTAWVETGDWLSSPATSARAFARQALDARLQRVLKRGKRLRHADDTARHQLRIETKKLRYAAEAFASLCPKKAAARFIDRTKDIQEVLGDLNDLAVAGPLMASLDLKPDAAFAAGELIGLRLAGKDQLKAKAAKAFKRLADADPPLV